jgi:DNA-binding GntR family transcriptional regulator
MAIEITSDKTSYDILKDMILDGEIASGQRLTEAYLSNLLQMSRIPVREALQQLVHEGFVERNEKNGYQVTEFNEQDIIDLYYFREALDGMIVRLFTQRMDTSQLFVLEMNLERMHKELSELDHGTFSKIDVEFHKIIARGARNRFMEHQHDIIMEKVIFIADGINFRDDSQPRENPKIEYYEDTYRQHSAIFDAIRKGNPDLAEKAARDSVKDGLMKVLFALSQSMNKLSAAPLAERGSV